MRNFLLMRDEDVSGVSGTGIVAEDTEFTNGKVVLAWLSQWSSVVVYDSVADLVAVHGHGGKTHIEWIDIQE